MTVNEVLPRSDATGLSPSRTYLGVCSRFYLIGEQSISSSGGEDAGVLSAVSKPLFFIYLFLSVARLLCILMNFLILLCLFEVIVNYTCKCNV